MKLQHGCLSWMNNVPRKRTEKYREEQRNPRRAGLVRGWTESINCTKTLIKVGEPQIALRKQPKKKGLRHTKGKKSFLTRVDCKNVWGKPSNNFFPQKLVIYGRTNKDNCSLLGWSEGKGIAVSKDTKRKQLQSNCCGRLN